MTQSGTLTVPLTRTLKIAGALSLQSGSTTTISGIAIWGSCTNGGGVLAGSGTFAGCP